MGLLALLAAGALSPLLNALTKPVGDFLFPWLNRDRFESQPQTVGPLHWDDRIYLFLITSPLAGAVAYAFSLAALFYLAGSKILIRPFDSFLFLFFVSGIVLLWQPSPLYSLLAAVSLALLSNLREWHIGQTDRLLTPNR